MNASKMRTGDDSKGSEASVMLVAIEMGLKSWRLAMAGFGASKHRQVSVAAGLLGLMQRQCRGERALRVVHVPTLEEEDRRQRTRERDELKVERGRLRVRMQSLLFAQGVGDFPKSVRQIERWLRERLDSVPKHLGERLAHELRLRLVDAQLKALDQAQHARCSQAGSSGSPADRTAARLCQLKGIGERSACLLASELFGWRRFHNRREVGALVGLVPTPYDSGTSCREQGISKAGNKRVRRTIIEVAWKWLDYQPDSALTRWFAERFSGGKRSKRIGIVALARRLLVALWHYLEHGVMPAGALLKA